MKSTGNALPSLAPRYEYTVIAIPPWCKDDALIIIFETNVGHKRLFVKNLTKAQRERLPKEAKNVANIVIRWESGAEKGDGLVVAFDWDKAFKGCRIEKTWLKDFTTYRWWYVRLKSLIKMSPSSDKKVKGPPVSITFGTISKPLANVFIVRAPRHRADLKRRTLDVADSVVDTGL